MLAKTVLLALLSATLAWPQVTTSTASRIRRGTGAPATGCVGLYDVGKVYINQSAAAPQTSLYACAQTGAGTYTWELVGILGAFNISCPLGVCTITSPAAGSVPLTVKGFAGQTANLQNWANSAGTVMSGIGPTGTFSTSTSTSGASIGLTGVNLGSLSSVYFFSGLLPGTLSDAALSRTSAGRLQINSASTGKWASLDVSNLHANAIASPGAPTVTPTCVPGVCNLTWTYTVTALDAAGNKTIPGAAASTALQNGTINATSYNTVTWAAVTGATSYTVRRTVSGGTPASLGALATCTGITGLSCVDNGLVGDASTAPTGNTTGTVIMKLETPAASAVSCTAGAIWADTGYIYVCTASGTVERAGIAAW